MKCLSLNGSLWNKERKTCVKKKCRVTNYKWRGHWIASKGAAFEYVFSFEKMRSLEMKPFFSWETLLGGTGSCSPQRKHMSQRWCLIARSAPCPEHPLILRSPDAHLSPRSDPGERRYGVWLHRLLAQFITLLLLVHTHWVPCSRRPRSDPLFH